MIDRLFGSVDLASNAEPADATSKASGLQRFPVGLTFFSRYDQQAGNRERLFGNVVPTGAEVALPSPRAPVGNL